MGNSKNLVPQESQHLYKLKYILPSTDFWPTYGKEQVETLKGERFPFPLLLRYSNKIIYLPKVIKNRKVLEN